MIDPQVLRLEPHGTIGALIQRDADTLVERWCRRAMEEQPHAARAHHEVLRDRLPSFLHALGLTLATSDGAEVHAHHSPALEHGEQRWQAGWSLPEVVLIDIGLPGMDGYEVTRKLREALGERVFLVALTGFGQPEDREHARRAGCNAHLVKPVDIQELTRLLAGLPA